MLVVEMLYCGEPSFKVATPLIMEQTLPSPDLRKMNYIYRTPPPHLAAFHLVLSYLGREVQNYPPPPPTSHQLLCDDSRTPQIQKADVILQPVRGLTPASRSGRTHT